MMYSPSKSPTPGQKFFTKNKALRRYSKAIVFKAQASEDLIFKNLAASFRLRPSMNISNFSLLPKTRQKTSSTLPSPQKHKKSLSEDFPVHPYTPVLKSQKNRKLQISVKKSLKPMRNQHTTEKLNLEIEGRPCSRAKKYEVIDSFTSSQLEHT